MPISSINETLLCKEEFAMIVSEPGKMAATQKCTATAVLALMSHCKKDVTMDSNDANHLVYCCECLQLLTIFYHITQSGD